MNKIFRIMLALLCVISLELLFIELFSPHNEDATNTSLTLNDGEIASPNQNDDLTIKRKVGYAQVLLEFVEWFFSGKYTSIASDRVSVSLLMQSIGTGDEALASTSDANQPTAGSENQQATKL